MVVQLRSLLSANSSLQKFNLVCLDLLRVPTGQSHIKEVFSAPELGESLPCIGGEAAAVDVNIRRFKHFLMFCEIIFMKTFPGSPLSEGASHPSVHHADCPRCQVVNIWEGGIQSPEWWVRSMFPSIKVLNMITSSNSTGKDRSPFHKEAVQE